MVLVPNVPPVVCLMRGADSHLLKLFFRYLCSFKGVVALRLLKVKVINIYFRLEKKSLGMRLLDITFNEGWMIEEYFCSLILQKSIKDTGCLKKTPLCV